MSLDPPALANVGGALAAAATIAWAQLAAVDVTIDAAFVTAATVGLTAIATGVTKLWRRANDQSRQIGRLEAAVEACALRDAEHKAEREEMRTEIRALRTKIDSQDGDGR
jgi:hypothetical protein